MATNFQVIFFSFLDWSVPTDRLVFTDLLVPFLIGSFPESLGQLKSLTELWLQDNKLTGDFYAIFVLVSPV